MADSFDELERLAFKAFLRRVGTVGVLHGVPATSWNRWRSSWRSFDEWEPLVFKAFLRRVGTVGMSIFLIGIIFRLLVAVLASGYGTMLP